jgi:hypothetical protein
MPASAKSAIDVETIQSMHQDIDRLFEHDRNVRHDASI